MCFYNKSSLSRGLDQEQGRWDSHILSSRLTCPATVLAPKSNYENPITQVILEYATDRKLILESPTQSLERLHPQM